MAKLAAVMTLVALLGSVACQSGYAPGPSPSSPRAVSSGSLQNPPRPSPSPVAYPPSQSPSSSTPPPPLYPLSPSPLSSTPPPTYPPPSPSSSPLSPIPPAYPPNPSPPICPPPPPSSSLLSPPSPPVYSPNPSPLSSTPPTYPPPPNPPSSPTYPSRPSSLNLISPTYPPNATPSPPTYPPSINPTPTASPPSANPPVYTSPSSSPTSHPPSISPTPATSPPPIANPPVYISPSPSPTNYPPTVSPSPIPPSNPPIASPTTYPSTSPSPGPSTPSPSTYPPTPSPSPSPSPSSSISSPPSYPPSPSPAPSGLSVGYYSYSCPNAESIVRDAVKSATDSNPGTGAGLIRLFFHDCFVEGCDGSVLLNTTGSTQPTERASPPNLSLSGFEVIDAAKASLEAACPGVVSCADIVAFAGRDATFFLSGNAVDFAMPAGRYDGRVSLSDEALANLPPPFAGVEDLKGMFAAKGLDADDMVTLSGAHTVGRSHCSSFSDRLPPNASDMNATLAASLSSQCNASGDPTVPQDLVTPSGLDSQYYRNVLNHEVLFGSDTALLASDETAGKVRDYAFTPGLWETKFKAAMVKMGRAGVKNSTNGEIRKKCWMVNQLST